MKEKIAKYMTVIVFLLLIFPIAIINVAKPPATFSENENRYMKTKVTFSVDDLINGELANNVEDYLTDQFVSRDFFMSLKLQIDYAFGKRENKEVIYGKDDYLFLKIGNPSKNLIDTNIKKLEEFASQNEKILGKEHVATTIIPSAIEILKDKRPNNFIDFDQAKLISDVKKSVTSGKFVDMTKTLSDHKNEEIFFKTDHHWTTYGAFLGYEKYCEDMNLPKHSINDFNRKTITENFHGTNYSKAHISSTPFDKIEEFTLKTPQKFNVEFNSDGRINNSLFFPEWLSKRDKYSYFLGSLQGTTKITSDNKNGKKLLLIGDSYSRSFSTILASSYEEIHLIDLRFFNKNLQTYIKDEGITDTLTMFYANGFVEDKNIVKMGVRAK